MRAFGQAQVLLGVELALQLEQLFRRERGTPPAGLVATGARRRRALAVLQGPAGTRGGIADPADRAVGDIVTLAGARGSATLLVALG